MGVSDYDVALASIDDDLADFEGAKDPSLIAAAEAYLGVAFPPSYARFLREFGAGNYGFIEIYGVIDADFENSSVPDAIWLTAAERAEAGFDRGFVLVGDTGYGGWIALDLRSGGAEAPVVEIDSIGRAVRPIADDFGCYFADVVAEVNDADG